METDTAIAYEDFPVICRVCLLHVDLRPFDLEILELFRALLSDSEEEIEEKLPQNICDNCSVQLKNLEEFSHKCRENEATLKNICLQRKNKYVHSSNADSDVEDKFDPSNVKCEDEEEAIKYNNNINEEEKIQSDNDSPNVTNKDEKETVKFNNKLSGKEEVCSDSDSPESNEQPERTSTQMKSQAKAVECEICNKVIVGRYAISNHKNFVHNSYFAMESDFECSFCGKKFKTKLYLQQHARTHTGIKPYQCSQCEKRFCQKSGLNIHLRNHLAEKPFKCTECEKSFIQSRHLKVHMRIHSGEKPFSCTYCGKAFPYANSLKIHLRLHTGEKFTCSYCSRGFHDPSNLKKHVLQKHTNVKATQKIRSLIVIK